MSKKVAMISQPMNGIPDEEIKKTRDKAVTILASLGYDVLNTYYEKFPNGTDVKHIPVAYLAKSIETMARCDAVFFCEGWLNARGCIVEHTIAEKYGLQIIEYSWFKEKEEE